MLLQLQSYEQEGEPIRVALERTGRDHPNQIRRKKAHDQEEFKEEGEGWYRVCCRQCSRLSMDLTTEAGGRDMVRSQ